MYNTFPTANYPYHGQPYHTYVPPHYSQQQPRFNFPGAQVPVSHTDSWPREKHAFPQSVGSPPNGHNPPFIPPDPDTQKTRRPKRASLTKPPPNSEKVPLKPALKKNGVARSESVSTAPPQRKRTDSERQRLAPMTRTRTNSNPSFLPDHMFVSFHGSNELRLGNVAYQDTLDEIRERLLPMWPHGVPTEITANHSWRATFPRNPWSATGPDSLTMITELFRCLSRHGYQYLTSLNNGYAYPQLIFKDVKQDEPADFFVGYLSRSGHKITLVRPPRYIGEHLGTRLRNAWPYKVASDTASEKEIYTVALKPNAVGAYNLHRDVFVSHTFQEISQMGYKLEATLHLPRVGIFTFGTKREIWVFKGPRAQSRPNSRSG